VWFTGGWRDAEIPGHAVTEVSVQSPALEWSTAEVIDTGLRLLDRIQN